ncbi:hypothetical protein MRB53_034882 [Persea americana]|uniref:Cytochrome P450 71A1 n=2 Tax=Persea americana TaxID=3435 RepID=C71A1_PERAE|nr:RecName: Full=Cytochrome P450 71A1; AltName: Full=ARP-2; AltName: Full=CYPLXXIA1 [Persea americana]AAA32913.1 cytochrome P-450LXXIA1 (cyp71A1) [Persea americana]KAJ8615510.1 hypothetical protein MRB53_034882 [Persea americana]|eukprot:TRINITY_DN17069_c0_g1_i1.p1 TRINITY_DN17069_c0_g1~~TRINITY_DN17069_c0_g1_i1.p1  ORF type:complete len:503 (-),score=84.15 TRINITY_DN17069_c0_g1_i1:204-1712(-)
MAILVSLLFLAIALTFFLLKLNEKREKKPNLPPSPPNLPIIGNLHQLGNLPHRSLRSLANELGPLILLHLGHIPTLIVSTAEIAEEILKTHDLIFASRPSTTAARRIFYDCTDVAFSPYGEYWRQVRKICVLELLSIKRVNSYRSIREEEVGLMMERISQSCSTGEAVNLSELLLLLSSGTITRVAFGKKYEGEEERKNKFADLATELTTLMGAFFVGDYFPSFAWVDVLTGMDARLKRNHGELDAFVDHVIDDHLLSRKANGSDGVEQKDLVDVLLHLQKDSSLGVHLNRNNLKAVILDMFSGGTDTTAVTLEWAMAELIKHPDVMEKAQQEVRRVVGKKAKVEEEDLHQLHYLKLIIKETLRLHPVAPLLVPRESTRDVVIRGYHIPAKTRVFINAWAIGRDPKSWENAEEFLPERFVNNSVDFKGQDFQLIPFGAGRRGCPGIAFGISSVEISLANLLYWFNWELPGDLTKEDLDMSEAVGITVHMKFPLQLVAKRHLS